MKQRGNKKRKEGAKRAAKREQKGWKKGTVNNPSVPYTMSDYYSLCGRYVVRYYPMTGFRVGKKTKRSFQ
jgi:hypothetical protein